MKLLIQFVLFFCLASVSQAQSLPAKTDTLTAKTVEEVFRASFFSHVLLYVMNKKISLANIENSKIQQVKSVVYWGVIGDYRDWLTSHKITENDMKKLLGAYESPEGKIYSKVMNPSYPFADFEKAILGGVVKRPASAPRSGDMRDFFNMINYHKHAETIITTVFNKHRRPANEAAIAQSYTRLIDATSVALHKEGMSDESFKKMTKAFVAADAQKIFSVLKGFTPDMFNKAISRRMQK